MMFHIGIHLIINSDFSEYNKTIGICQYKLRSALIGRIYTLNKIAQETIIIEIFTCDFLGIGLVLISSTIILYWMQEKVIHFISGILLIPIY